MSLASALPAAVGKSSDSFGPASRRVWGAGSGCCFKQPGHGAWHAAWACRLWRQGLQAVPRGVGAALRHAGGGAGGGAQMSRAAPPARLQQVHWALWQSRARLAQGFGSNSASGVLGVRPPQSASVQSSRAQDGGSRGGRACSAAALLPPPRLRPPSSPPPPLPAQFCCRLAPRQRSASCWRRCQRTFAVCRRPWRPRSTHTKWRSSSAPMRGCHARAAVSEGCACMWSVSCFSGMHCAADTQHTPGALPS